MSVLNRRTILKASGVILALPFLQASEKKSTEIKRFVALQMPFGFLPEFLYPQNGKDSEYLQHLNEFKDNYTLFNGLHNPGINGGHDANYFFLTCGNKNSKVNSISIDQEIAARYSGETRFKSLVTGAGFRAGASYTRSGIKIPIQENPAKVFETLFLGGSKKEIDKKKNELTQGKSILDAFTYYQKKMRDKSGKADHQKLDEYFTSVRELEKELQMSEEWLGKPLPKVEKPEFPKGKLDEIDNFRVFAKLFKLVLETDSTRIITYDFGQTRNVLNLEGINEGYHSLSHHRLNEDKISQLKIIETEMFKILGQFLKSIKEAGLLESTITVFGSGLENPNNHSAAKPPLLVAGGALKHRGYVEFEKEKPIANLYLTLLEKMGVPKNSFGSSDGKIDL